MKEIPEGFYEKRTEYGLCICKEYSWKGAKLEQRTLTMGQMLEITDVLLSLDVKGLADISDVGANVNVQAVIREALARRRHGDLLSLLLWDENGNHPDKAAFDACLAHEFVDFAGEVLLDFFTLNDTLSERFVMWFIRLFSRMAEKVNGLIPQVQQFIASQMGILPAAPQSSKSTKRSRMSG